MAGIAIMVLPLPMRMGSLDAFVESTRARIRHGDAKLVLIDDLLAAFYEAGARRSADRADGRGAARARRRAERRSPGGARRPIPSGSSSCSTRAARPASRRA